MSLSVYSGVMGSGKTYEGVLFIVLPALAAGRRVVTNIDGIKSDACREYVAKTNKIDLAKVGTVVSVTNEEVASDIFYPISQGSDALVSPGDLVVIDEAWRFYGVGESVSPSVRVFFREHRHYTDPDSGVSCDIVLLVQDIGDLHRMVKVVVETSFRCKKLKQLGLNNTYSVSMWEGYKQTPKSVVKEWTRRYDPDIFPLYSSYSGSKNAVESKVDSRQGIFSGRSFKLKIIFFVLIVCLSSWRIWSFFHRFGGVDPAPSASKNIASFNSSAAVARSEPVQSNQLRIAGTIQIDGVLRVIIAGASGLRIESIATCSPASVFLTCLFDGKTVTRFSSPPTDKQK